MFSLYTLVVSIFHYLVDYRSHYYWMDHSLHLLLLTPLKIDLSTRPIWKVNAPWLIDVNWAYPFVNSPNEAKIRSSTIRSAVYILLLEWSKMDFYWETSLMLAGECGNIISKCLFRVNVHVKGKISWMNNCYHFHLPVSKPFLISVRITYSAYS